MDVRAWRAYPPIDFSAALEWPTPRLAGIVLGVPDNASAAEAIDTSLRLAVARGLAWSYPAVACEHSAGPHAGSCRYAELPSYWATLVETIERINGE